MSGCVGGGIGRRWADVLRCGELELRADLDAHAQLSLRPRDAHPLQVGRVALAAGGDQPALEDVARRRALARVAVWRPPQRSADGVGGVEALRHGDGRAVIEALKRARGLPGKLRNQRVLRSVAAPEPAARMLVVHRCLLVDELEEHGRVLLGNVLLGRVLLGRTGARVGVE